MAMFLSQTCYIPIMPKYVSPLQTYSISAFVVNMCTHNMGIGYVHVSNTRPEQTAWVGQTWLDFELNVYHNMIMLMIKALLICRL